MGDSDIICGVLRMLKIPINEIFGPTLQGEGKYIGCPAIFVRVSGCDLCCPECDTKYAWGDSGATMMTPGEIVRKVVELAGSINPIVVLTGGNPAMYQLGPVVDGLNRECLRIHVETQGTMSPDWLVDADLVTISPKMSMGISTTENFVRYFEGHVDMQLKVVAFDDASLERALVLHKLMPRIPMVIQQGWNVLENKCAMELDYISMVVLNDERSKKDIRVLPQLHRIIWGDRHGI